MGVTVNWAVAPGPPIVPLAGLTWKNGALEVSSEAVQVVLAAVRFVIVTVCATGGVPPAPPTPQGFVPKVSSLGESL